MFEIVYRYDPESPHLPVPQTASEARLALERGNRHFAEVLQGCDLHVPGQRVLPLDPLDYGLGGDEGSAPAQEPWAAVLGCADARVPVEIIFEQGCNDLFVVRVAGNVVGSECLGSLGYATHNFHSLKLIAVLGHLHCGAVAATVDAYLNPSAFVSIANNYPLQSIVNRVLAPVRASAMALQGVHGEGVRQNPGYRNALVETSVTVNAAWGAHSLQLELTDRDEGGRQVVFGVYDLASRFVRLPLERSTSSGADIGLHDPPRDSRGFEELAQRLAAGEYMRGLLGM